jgi:hypothetical protein
VQVNASNTGMTRVKWAVPAAGTYVKFAVSATGGATLRLQVRTNGVLTYDSQNLANGESQRFIWPATPWITLIATSGTSGPSSVKAELIPLP